MKAKPRLITARLLRARGACAEQVQVFREMFPQGTPVTLADCRKAVKAGLDFNWAANYLLTSDAWKVYQEAAAAANKVYNEAVATAYHVYNEAVAAACKVCDEAVAPARNIYIDAVSPAHNIYGEAVATAWKVYDEAAVVAFYRAWKSQK